MKSERGAFVRLAGLMAIVVAFEASTAPAAAANPAWRGAEFQRVFSDGDTLPGLTQGLVSANAVTTEQGLFLYSYRAGARGTIENVAIHLFDGQQWTLAASRGTPGLSNATSLNHLGMWQGDSVLFLPVIPNGAPPIYQWNGSVGSFLSPDQFGLNPQVAGGRLVYSEAAPGGGFRVLLGPQGAATEILNESLAPGLTGHLALDANGSLLFMTGSAAQANESIWLRRPDGTLKRLIGDQDPLPGGTRKAVVGAETVALIDGAYAYLAVDGEGDRQRDPQRVLFRSDGDNVEPLLGVGIPALGLGGVAVASFAVGSVNAGQLFAVATLAGGRKAVMHWEAGTWTEVFDVDDLFDGEKPLDFTLFRDGHSGDSLTARLRLGARSPVNRLYTNARFAPVSPAPQWIAERPENSPPKLVLQGRPAASYQILGSGDLRTWEERAVIVTGEDGRWVLEPPAAAVEFYQARELSTGH